MTRSSRPTDWTDHHTTMLLALAEEGLPMAEVGRRLGVSKNAAIGRLWRVRRARKVATDSRPRPSMPTLRFLEMNL
jgi:hypothetical protein